MKLANGFPSSSCSNNLPTTSTSSLTYSVVISVIGTQARWARICLFSSPQTERCASIFPIVFKEDRPAHTSAF